MRDYPNYPAIHELMAAFIRKMDYLVLCDRAHLLTQQLVREDPRIMRGASTSEMLKRYLGLPVLDEPVFGPGNWMLTP
ncbi:MAG: hypothetical protein BWZ10_02216 [candidate division BRC1 bacterium ADurb.BinA364]|nr:MAG: hypothetical protein BWZ10_02216 [candidate division BRC1 bacterium ADurb.BinA364]